MINIIYVSRFQGDTDAKIGAIGLGNVVIAMFGVASYIGLNGALNALTAQAFGSNQLELCGIYLQQARVVLILFYIATLPVFICSE